MRTKFFPKVINVFLAIVLLTGLMLTAVPVQPALAATITVDGTTCSLSDAILAANNDTTQGGCLAGSGADTIDLLTDVTLSAALPVITSEIVLEGNGHTVDGDSAFQVFSIIAIPNLWDGDLTIIDLTVTNGLASGSGGGIQILSGSMTVISSTITNNSSGSGGGIFNQAGSLTISDSTLSNNQATAPDEIGDGGGIFNTGTMTLTNVTLFENQSADQGGGVFNSGGTSKLENVSFSGNQAVKGGGYFNSNHSRTELINAEIFGNISSMDGAGIMNRGTISVTNSTLSGNQALGNGGGVYNSNSNALFQNTIIWNNEDISGTQMASSSIFNVSGTPTIRYSDFEGCGNSGAWDTACGVDGGNNIEVDPMFVMPVDLSSLPTTNGDLHLQHNSAAIEAGDNLVCPMIDLDGGSRPRGVNCDLGPFEYDGIGLIKTASASEVDLTEIFTYTIRVVNAYSETLSGGVISDSLPAELNFVGPITLDPSDAGTVGSLPELVTELEVGVGEQVTVTFPVSVSYGVAAIAYTNTVSLSGSLGLLPLIDTVVVSISNVAPVAADDSGSEYYTYLDTPFTTGNVLDNDYDANGDELSVLSFDTSVLSGTLTSNGDGTFDYDPNGMFDDLAVGQDAHDVFTYVVSDGVLTDTATVTVTINGSMKIFFPWVSQQ